MTKKHTEAVEATAATGENIELETVASETSNQNGESIKTKEMDRIAQLEQELELANQTKDEYYNKMLRTQADFENFRRRSRQELEQITCYAGEDLLKKVLPVIDSLERAISCFTENTDQCSWQEGVDLTHKQFLNILKSEGLEYIEALNQPFDPQVHEAVLQEEADQFNTPTVIAEMQKGYKFKGKLLRPALVKVGLPKVG